MDPSIVLHLLTMVGIYGLAALGLNVQYGLAGLANFGVAGFFGLGAYTAAILAVEGQPFVVCMVAAVAMSGLAGGLLARVIARLKESYWAIATIGFAEVLRIVVVNEGWLTRGTMGIEGIPRPLADTIGAQGYAYAFLAFVAVLVVVCLALCVRVQRSPQGRTLRLLRENEDMALSLGKPVDRHRVRALALGSALMGLSGATYAYYITHVSPEDMTITLTLLVWCMLVVGGKGRLVGGMVGVVVIVLLYNSTRYLKDFVPLGSDTLASIRMVVIGLLLIVMMIKRPSGLLPEGRKAFP